MALGTIVWMSVEVVVIAVMGGLTALYVFKRLSRELFASKKGELAELNRQITTAREEHGLVRVQLATAGALKDDPDLLLALGREAAILALASKRALMQWLGDAQERYAAAATSAQENGISATCDVDRESWERDARHYYSLMNDAVKYTGLLAADIASAVKSLESQDA